MRSFLIASAAALALLATAPAALAQSPKQGGAAVVTFNNDLTTLDPQVGYDWQNWSVIKSIFDGLMDEIEIFRRDHIHSRRAGGRVRGQG